MKAISLWQPWASAIVLGYKRIETRGWSTRTRGTVAIHAAKVWRSDERDWARHFSIELGSPEIADPPRGALIGTARLVAILPSEALVGTLTQTERDLGNYAPGRFGWMLEDATAFAHPVPYRGMQGLFEVPDDVIRAAMEPRSAG